LDSNPADLINIFRISEWTQMSISELFRYQNDCFQSDIFSSDIGITDVDVGCRILPTLRSMSMPTYGYVPPFHTLPTAYYRVNIQLALDNLDFARDKVNSWVQASFAIELASPAYCASTLSVASKHDPCLDSVKLRPVLDLGRHVNLCGKYTVCQLN
jgi:hypothetical protein